MQSRDGCAKFLKGHMQESSDNNQGGVKEQSQAAPPTHEANVDVATNAHAIGQLSRHPAYQLQQERLLDVLVPVNLWRDRPRQLGENLRHKNHNTRCRTQKTRERNETKRNRLLLFVW